MQMARAKTSKHPAPTAPRRPAHKSRHPRTALHTPLYHFRSPDCTVAPAQPASARRQPLNQYASFALCAGTMRTRSWRTAWRSSSSASVA